MSAAVNEPLVGVPIERPILMSGPMVLGCLTDRKTQSRRTRGLELVNTEVRSSGPDRFQAMRVIGGQAGFRDLLAPDSPPILIRCPYGKVGDQLWVREAWCAAYSKGCWGTIFRADEVFVQGKRQHKTGTFFNADDRVPRSWMKWKPSIHLPRWASRLSLRIVRIRVERLHEISKQDILAEGLDDPIIRMPCGAALPRADGSGMALLPAQSPYVAGRAPGEWQELDAFRCVFADAWERINGKGSWEINPWVWVLGFERVT